MGSIGKLSSGGTTVSCSVCLEHVSEGGDRSVAKLKCGHHFHLDCIGSAFNAKGVMQCPNCRCVEEGQWLYGSRCRADGGHIFPDDVNVSPEDFPSFDHDYNEMYSIPESLYQQELMQLGLYCPPFSVELGSPTSTMPDGEFVINVLTSSNPSTVCPYPHHFGVIEVDPGLPNAGHVGGHIRSLPVPVHERTGWPSQHIPTTTTAVGGLLLQTAVMLPSSSRVAGSSSADPITAQHQGFSSENRRSRYSRGSAAAEVPSRSSSHRFGHHHQHHHHLDTNFGGGGWQQQQQQQQQQQDQLPQRRSGAVYTGYEAWRPWFSSTGNSGFQQQYDGFARQQQQAAAAAAAAVDFYNGQSYSSMFAAPGAAAAAAEEFTNYMHHYHHHYQQQQQHHQQPR